MASLAVKTGIRLGLLTAAIILLFQLSGVFLIYHYFKFEYYVSAVAAIFLASGFLIARWKNKTVQSLHKADPVKQLTIKELQIFEAILSGKSNKEIAAENFVEASTIKTHINNIYAKLTVASRKELMDKFRKK